MIRIEFDAADLAPSEAGALVAFLCSLHPSAAEYATGVLTPAPLLHTVKHDAAETVQELHPAIVEILKTPAEPPPVMDPAVAFAPLASPAAPSAAAPAAPPPPAVTAPPIPASAPTQSPPANAAGLDVDTNGIPWDSRIHSSPAKKNQDGSWRGKRGVAADLVASVTAELKQAAGAPAPLPPAAIAAAQAAALVEAATGAPPAPPPVAPAAPPAPPAPAALSPQQAFANLMQKVAPAQAAGKLTMEEVAAMLAPHGLQQLSQLFTRPDIVAVVEPQIDALIASRA